MAPCRHSVAIRLQVIGLVSLTNMTNTHVKFAMTDRTWSIIVTLLLATSFTCARRSGGGGGYSHSSHSTGSHSSHSYPHSTGLSGTGAGGSHTYPQSTGLSGNNYVHQQQQQKHATGVSSGHKTEVHHHYTHHHYAPPQHVTYGSVNYPVYHGQPPVYVYKYRDSGSRFGDLLTGLALYNLGRMSAHNHHYYNERREYRGPTGEICKLGVRKANGDYEETRVDCQLMSSFIWDSELHGPGHDVQRNTVSVVNVTQVISGGSSNDSAVNGHLNMTTVTITNTTVVDALQAKGESISVTPGMTCYMIRILQDTSAMKKEIKCGVLQAYARNSWRPNASARLYPSFCFVMLIVIQMLVYVF